MNYRFWGTREKIEELGRRTSKSVAYYSCWGERELLEELEKTEANRV
jgi:hypothetical protein